MVLPRALALAPLFLIALTLRAPAAGLLTSQVPPKHVGETTTSPSADNDRAVTVRGRVLDEQLVPIANHVLSVDVASECQIGQGSSTSSNRTRPNTDAEGWFELTIARRSEKDCKRTLFVRLDRSAEQDALGESWPSAQFPIADVIEGARLDLGQIRLSTAASPFRYQLLSDEELASATHAAVADHALQSDRRLEGLLTEMARRGGARFEALLTAELAHLHEPVDPQKYRREDLDLFVLTALRRVQRAPDPLALRVKPGSDSVAVFPQSPVFHVTLVNADKPGASMTVAEGGGYRSGRLERWHVDVRTLDGKRIEPIPWRGGMGGGLLSYRVLAPGDTIDADIRLGNYVVVTEPGTYEARIHYHDEESIANEHDLGNLIMSTSEWTRFEIQARTVRLTRAEDERARRAVADAAVPESIVVYWAPWDPDQPFTGQPRTSEEVLFALGWKSVRALVAALDEPGLSVRKRAWILAELYNLTGLNDPSAQPGLVGKHEHTPGPLDTGTQTSFAFVTGWSGDGPIEEPKQRAFAERWKQTARGFRFEIAD